MDVKNPEANTCFEKTHFITVPEVSPDRLALSDIELAFNIRTDEDETSNRSFLKGEYIVTPYPYDAIKRSQPIFVYFEIYDLMFDDSGSTSYEVEYELRSARSGFFSRINPFFKRVSQSSSYQLHGDKRNTQEHFSLNLEKVKPGDYELKVSVRDYISEKHEEAKVEFRIIE